MAPLASPSTVCCPRLLIKSCTAAPNTTGCGRKHASGRTLLPSSALGDLLVGHDLAALYDERPDNNHGRVDIALAVELDVLRRAILVVRVHEVEDVFAGGLTRLERVEEDVRGVPAL